MRVQAILIAGFSIVLMGQDVEHHPVVIEPPAKEPMVIPAPRNRGNLGILTPRRFDLRPRLDFEPPPARPKPQLSEAERVKSRIDGYFEDLMAHRRAQVGNVDPGWRFLERRMDHFFVPDYSLVNDPEITEISGAWLRKEFWNWLAGWYRQASRTGADGFTPYDPEHLKSIDTSLLDMQLAAYQDEGYGSTVTTLVEVRIDAQGNLDARLFGSSGHPRFDRAALEAVEKAIASPFKDQLPPGPARSRYAISARYAILPPLPVVGFSFDFLLGYFDLMYPLKKTVRGNARLVAVYRDSTP